MNSRKVMKILIKVLENRPKKKFPKTEYMRQNIQECTKQNIQPLKNLNSNLF